MNNIISISPESMADPFFKTKSNWGYYYFTWLSMLNKTMFSSFSGFIEISLTAIILEIGNFIDGNCHVSIILKIDNKGHLPTYLLKNVNFETWVGTPNVSKTSRCGVGLLVNGEHYSISRTHVPTTTSDHPFCVTIIWKISIFNDKIT